jgi:RNA polymerase sigma-70 factor (ECF subfamily)
MEQYASPDFAYEVREHISYCFTCVGRSLPPDELAALVLRDVVDMSAKEASTALGISDSVLRHRLAAARTAMQDRYEGLCSLVSKKGICHQCKGLQMIAPDDRKGGDFPDLDDFKDRCEVVRNCSSTSMEQLHNVFWRNTRRIEDEELGSVEPESDCGTDND